MESTGYHLTVYQDSDSFNRLKKDWITLAAEDDASTVFQTWTWMYYMWKLEAKGQGMLRLLALYDREGRMLALLPLMIERCLGPLNIRVLRFIGQSFSDYLDILLSPEAETDRVMQDVTEWMQSARGEYDIISFSNLSETSRILNHKKRLFSEETILIEHEYVTDECRYIPVTDTWQDYFSSLKKNVRSELKRRSKQLEKDHSMVFWTEDGSVNPHSSISEFISLHQLRHESKFERGLFRNPHRTMVFSVLLRDLLETGNMRLFFISVNGVPRATNCALEFKNKMYFYVTGIDTSPSLLKYGLGKLIKYHVLKSEFSKNYVEFNFGRGNERYKADFARHVRRNYRFVRFYSHWKGPIFRIHERFLSIMSCLWIRKLYFRAREWTFLLFGSGYRERKA